MGQVIPRTAIGKREAKAFYGNVIVICSKAIQNTRRYDDRSRCISKKPYQTVG